MKQIRVELAKWVDGQGFAYEEDIDSYELADNDWETVETYINSPRFEDPESEATEIPDGEDYEIRIYTDGVLTDSAWLSEVTSTEEEEDMKNFEVGTIYSDPTGIYRVDAINESGVTVTLIAGDDLNKGKTYEGVSADEVAHFVENPFAEDFNELDYQ